MRIVLFAFAAGVMLATDARAQTDPALVAVPPYPAGLLEPADPQKPIVPRRPWGQLRLGKLWLTPAVALKELGIDTNVFNSSAAEGTTTDLYAVAGPQVTLLLDSKRVRLDGVFGGDYTYYAQSISERSLDFNVSMEGRFQVAKRLEFGAGAARGSSRRRFSPEVDLRARNWNEVYSLTSKVTLVRRVSINLFASASERRFDDGTVYNRVPLQLTLDEDQQVAGGALAYAVTPWTRVSIGGEASRHLFPRLPIRDADGERYGMRLEMNPRALIFGSAGVGWRNYRTRSAEVEDFEDWVGDGMLGSQIGTDTTVRVIYNRDVAMSYLPAIPFLLNRNVSLSVQRMLFARTALVLEAHDERYAYRGFIAVRPGELPPPDEQVERYAARILVRVGGDFTVGFVSDYSIRDTVTPGRQYEGLRFWTTVQYGRFSVRDRGTPTP